MKKICIHFFAITLLFGCSTFDSTRKPEQPAMQIVATDPASPIEVAAGNEFDIVLESNISTGFRWKIVGDLDSDIVEFVDSQYVSANSRNMAGSGGLDTWTFKATKAGEIQITLGYYPPSNKPVPPQQTMTFTVIVK